MSDDAVSDIPEGWASGFLNEIGELFSGQSPSTGTVNNEGNGTPYVTGPEQWDGSKIHQNKWTTSPKRLVPDGCIFITVKGAGVGTLFPGIACAIGRDIYAYRPSASVSREYIRFALQHTIDVVVRNAAGLIPGLTRDHLLGHTIPLPPLAEQKRIVAKVETLLSRVNAARQRLAKVPALLKRFRQSVLAAACSGHLTEDWRIRHADAPQWTKTQLGEVCEIIGGSQPPKDNFIYEPRDGYIRFIQIRDYKSDDHLTFIPQAMARRFCSKTDVMIGRYGPPLFQILRGIEGAYNVALMKAVPRNESLANDFLFYLLQDPPLRQDVIQFSERTVGQDGVRKDLLEVYEVQVPPLAEQHEIVRRVEALLARADRIEKRLATATRRVETLTQAILAQAFRGELVPTEADLARQEGRDYEPASVLLERVRVISNETKERHRERSARKSVQSRKEKE